MNIGILSKKYVKMPDFSDREILRYAGVKDGGEALLSLLSECKAEISCEVKNAVVYKIFPVRTDGVICDFGTFTAESKNLSAALKDAEYALFMAATLGVGADRLICKYSHINTAMAHMLNSVATERIEALCNAFCADINKDFESEGFAAGFRFSPGYGDLSIDFQKEIFAALEPHKHIGLTLNESLMMSPSKSVSAVMALKRIGEMK